MASSNNGFESYVVVASEQKVSSQATPSNVSSSEAGASTQAQIPVVAGDAEQKSEDDAEVKSKKGSKEGEDNTDEDKKSKENDDDNNDQSDEEDEEAVVVGMVCGTKDLYQKVDEWNNVSWTTKYPDGLEEAAEDADTAKFALLVRNSRSPPELQIDRTPDTC